MNETSTTEWTSDNDEAEVRIQGVIGDLDGEPVLALIVRLPDETCDGVGGHDEIGASWRWTTIIRGGEAGLALYLSISAEGETLLRDQLVFVVGKKPGVDQLQCLMRQPCLPAILLDSRLNELARLGFEWTPEDRSEVATLTADALARSYRAKEPLPGAFTQPSGRS